MSWATTHRALVERARRIADGSTEEHSAGFDGRLLEALQEYVAHIGNQDVSSTRLMAVALGSLGHPPFDATPRLFSFLLSLLGHDDLDALLIPPASASLLATLRRGTRVASELDPERALSLVERLHIPATTRLFTLVHAPHERWSHVEELLADATPSVEELVDLHRLVLERGELGDARTHTALEALYTRSSWLGRRVLLSGLGHEHVDVLPALVSVAPRVDAMTRFAAIEAMGRMGHIAAEPYLMRVLDEQRDAQSMAAAASALGTLGTLAALPALRTAERFDAGRSLDVELVRWRSQRAIEQIMDRFPTKAARGGLTLAEEHTVAGALTLAGASEGDISLYEAMQARVDEGQKKPRPQALATTNGTQTSLAPLNEPFQRLVPGPRRVPLGYYAEQYGFLEGAGLVMWPFMTATIALLPSLLAMDFGTALFFLVFTHGIPLLGIAGRFYTQQIDKARILTHGTPTYGQLDDLRVEVQEIGGSTVRRHIYTFKYMTEDQRIETAERVFRAAVPQIEDEPFEALLHHKGEVVLFDEFTNLKVSEDGQLATGSNASAFYLIPPLIWLATLVMIILQYAGVIGFMF